MSHARPADGARTHPPHGGEVAFRVDGVDHRWRHVVAHARRGGDWAIFVTEVRQALACIRRATEEGPPVEPDAERDAAIAFRRARRLHAAEDVEAWLRARGLTVRQWRRYLRGELLRRRHAADLADLVDRYPIDDADLGAALPVWGWCAGTLPRWSERLATRAAAAHAVGDDRLDGGGPQPDDLEGIERGFDRFAAERATPERLTALISARYLDWLRIDCDIATFVEVDTAHEALACIREDGWSLAETARAAGGTLRRRNLLVEEVEAADRPRFVRARDGDLVGPVAMAGRPALVAVHRKRTPSLDDPEVRVRATRELVTTAAAREVDSRVTWLHPR